ncbi:MAG: hypothetical protein WAL71_08090 [Terriglobales bacterium]|jgi:hypothetical protein
MNASFAASSGRMQALKRESIFSELTARPWSCHPLSLAFFDRYLQVAV